MNKNTSIARIEKHLMTHKKITSMEAFEKYKVTRLSSIIYDLRSKGYPIKTTMVEGINDYGQPIRYGVYSIPSKWSKKSLNK